MGMQILADWTLERLQVKTTSAAIRNPATGEWTTERAALHETVVNERFA
jgi:hypothetical protein